MAQPNKPDDDLIEVTVKSQNGKFEDKFVRTTTVQTIVAAAASKLGFDPSDRLELVLENDRGNVLNPSTTLESLVKTTPGHGHGQDKLHFVLTAIGNGV